MSGARKKTFSPGESVTVEDITNEVAKLANVQPQEMQKEKTFDWKHMSKQIKSQVMGQDSAIDQIMEKIVMHRAGLSDPNKPILSALFQGSSGCGKTETTIQLSKQLDMPLVRFDMSEYQEKHSVSKFIGAPPGYVGYEEGNDGALINAVEKNPSCIILLDEVEKAHPDVLKILLQVLDYGTLTSSKDKKSNFRNSIIIMTTNLGAQDAEMKKSIGFFRDADYEQQETVDKAVSDFFAPEFRNRIDLIIKFNKLGRLILEQITDKFLTDLNQQLYGKNIDVSLTDMAKERIIDLAQEQNLGARPVKRLIDQHIRVPLGYLIVDSQDLQAKSIEVDFVDNEFKFNTQRQQNIELTNNLQMMD
jgi:ATP-dependent Clp protease ATP-binding subunit ClpA